MPALLLAGTRFLAAGAILLAWCRWRGLRLLWPPKTMLLLALIGLLLLGGGNVGLCYAEIAVPSGLASLAMAVIPIYVALIEMLLPAANPCPRAVGSVWRWALPASSLSCGRRSINGLVRRPRTPLVRPRAALRGPFLGRRQRCLPPCPPHCQQLRGRRLANADSLAPSPPSSAPARPVAALPRQRARSLVAGLSRHLRLPARLQRLHLSARARPRGQGRFLRLRQSCRRRPARHRPAPRAPRGRRIRRHGRHRAVRVYRQHLARRREEGELHPSSSSSRFRWIEFHASPARAPHARLLLQFLRLVRFHWESSSRSMHSSARTSAASFSTCACASARVKPYASTPGKPTASAIQRPSSSRSNSISALVAIGSVRLSFQSMMSAPARSC